LASCTSPVSRGLQGRMRRVEATYKPQRRSSLGASCSRYAASDWCGLPAASSFSRHWRRCSDGQRGKYVRRSLDADGCRDQYHKRKPLQVAFNALQRISCCNQRPSQLRNLFETKRNRRGVQNEGVLKPRGFEDTCRSCLFSNFETWTFKKFETRFRT
jgi:hypothetical protein